MLKSTEYGGRDDVAPVLDPPTDGGVTVQRLMTGST